MCLRPRRHGSERSMKRGQRTTKVVKSLRNGQVTLPADFRRELGIEPDTLLEVSLGEGSLTITPVHTTRRSSPGSPWLQELYDLFAPVREAASAYAEDEIDATIDAAVKGGRSRHAGAC